MSNESNNIEDDKIQKFICKATYEHEDIELDIGLRITVTCHRPIKSAKGFVYFRPTTSMEAIIMQPSKLYEHSEQ